MSVFLPRRRKKAGYVAKWIDPVSGEPSQRTLGQFNKRDAYQKAAELAEQIVAGVSLDGTSWLEFCGEYERRCLSRRSPKSIESWGTTKWLIEESVPLKSIQAANRQWVGRFLDVLYQRDSAKNTVATYAARLRAALNWAEREGFIARAPYVPVEWEPGARSRAINLEEFEKLLIVVPKIRPQDSESWKRLLHGQWESGLRIGELLQLSWDLDAPIALVTAKKWPLIRFSKQKNKKRQWAAVTKEFWAICEEVPTRERHGPVFPIPGKSGQMTEKRVINRISEFGRTAGIVTNHETGKTATSHDIRRAFGIRMIERLGILGAQMQLRHSKAETTTTWYDTRDAEYWAAILWGEE